jgi:hypothetical protein
VSERCMLREAYVAFWQATFCVYCTVNSVLAFFFGGLHLEYKMGSGGLFPSVLSESHGRN